MCVCWRITGPERRPAELFPEAGQLSGFQNLPEVQKNNAAETGSVLGSGPFFPREAESHQSFCPPPLTSGPPRCGHLLPPGERMFSRSLAGPVPSKGSVEPEWSSEGKIAGELTSGFDFREICFQTRKGGLSCDSSSHSDFTISLWVFLKHTLSKKKPNPDLATCFLHQTQS